MRSEKYIQPDELNVDNVFENVNYVIPIYQRNYAWRKDEIEQLLMDIDDLDETNSSKYYLGSLVVNQCSRNGISGDETCTHSWPRGFSSFAHCTFAL